MLNRLLLGGKHKTPTPLAFNGKCTYCHRQIYVLPGEKKPACFEHTELAHQIHIQEVTAAERARWLAQATEEFGHKAIFV